MYLLSSNIGEIGLVSVAMLAGMPLPLSAVQILYVNLATDGLPALALAVDPPETGLMRHKPRSVRTGIFTRPVILLMLVGGIWSTIVNFTLFSWALRTGHALPEAMTMTFVALVLMEFFKAYNFRSDRHSVMRRPFANKWLNLTILWELLLLAAVVYVPVLQRPFATFSLSPADWAILIVAAVSICPVLDLAKCLERLGWFGKIT
jgi:Ca2+-transporting ATPase